MPIPMSTAHSNSKSTLTSKCSSFLPHAAVADLASTSLLGLQEKDVLLEHAQRQVDENQQYIQKLLQEKHESEMEQQKKQTRLQMEIEERNGQLMRVRENHADIAKIEKLWNKTILALGDEQKKVKFMARKLQQSRKREGNLQRQLEDME